MKRLLIVLVALLLSACDAVYTSHPPGNKAMDIEGEEESWQGVWISPEGFTITVKVMDAANGILRAGWIQNQSDDLKYKSLDIHLREYEDWNFASARIVEPGRDDIYLWGRITRPRSDNDIGKLVLWVPNAKTFAELVREGTLTGSSDFSRYSTTVELGQLMPKDLKLITSGTRDNLFLWDRPIMFIHLSSSIENWM